MRRRPPPATTPGRNPALGTLAQAAARLSATPHDGRARSFASLMNMLDATALTDPDNYTKEDFSGKGLVIRRFNKDIRNQVRDAFREREITRDAIAAGEPAERFDARLTPASSGGEDLLALFLGTKAPEDEPPTSAPDLPPAPMSLFESDIAYCETALHRLRAKDHALRFETDEIGSVLSLDAPEDLRRRYSYFPREVFPETAASR